MANHFQLIQPNILRIVFEGDQDANSVQFAISQVKETILALRSRNEKVFLLVDVFNLGTTHTSARKVGMELLKSLDYDKASILGKDLYTKYLVKFIILGSGKQDKIQYFTSEASALNYLKT